MNTPHVNPSALAHFLVLGAHEHKIHIATEAAITPGHLHDLEVGRNLGTNVDLRQRVADALGVPIEAITCWCDRPDGRCRARPFEGEEAAA